MDWEAISKELERPLDPRHVVRATGGNGPKGDYIEGWHAIKEANRIFGFGGWSYTTELQKVCEFQNERGNYEIGFICNCSVTVGDVTRQDVGYGSGAAKKIGDAYEGAVKEAVTDALKRCLRTFGNPFGLPLYDKSKADVRVDTPPPDFAAIRDRIKSRIVRCVSQDDLADVWKTEKEPIALLKREDPPKFGELVKFKDEAKAKLHSATPMPGDFADA